MKTLHSPTTRHTGFTLVEMAVVLVIIGLMLGGLLMPLSAQMEKDRREETQATLNAIRDALIGYAVVNGTLPCPDTTVPPDGLPDACNNSPNQRNRGGLPYGVLGIARTDAWGNAWTYAVNGAYTVAFTRTTPGSITNNGNGDLEVWDAANCGGTRQLGERLPALVVSNATTTNGGALEPDNRNTNRCYVDAGYIQGANGFDDLLIWIPEGLLFSRMVAAGTL